jgi:hypothetical protein
LNKKNTDSLTSFWNLLNSMLQNVSGKADYKFNPTGFVADEHHANWRSINSVFGQCGTERTVSCEFHFKQSVHRQARRLTNATEFIRLSNGLIEAITESEFAAACVAIEQLIMQHTSLNAWFNWWMERKTHIFRAYKPHNSPATNLAEVGHSKLSSVGRRGMSLLEAARNDVALAIRQEIEMKCFADGLSSGGRGLSAAQKRAKTYKCDMKLAAAYGSELQKSILPPQKRPKPFVPLSGAHRPADNISEKRTGISSQQRKLLHKKSGQKTQVEKGKSSHLRGNQAEEVKFSVVRLTLLPTVQVCYGCGSKFALKYKKTTQRPNSTNVLAQALQRQVWRRKSQQQNYGCILPFEIGLCAENSAVDTGMPL